MSAVSKVIARAILKMDAHEMRVMIALLAREYEIEVSVPPEVPHGYVLVPRQMTSAMLWAAMDHTWTTHTADTNIRRMWDNILSSVAA